MKRFYDTGLKSFIIHNNVIEVGENIIGASINLTTISFGDGIKSFKDVHIQEKDIIEYVSIGKSVKSIAQDIFRWYYILIHPHLLIVQT